MKPSLNVIASFVIYSVAFYLFIFLLSLMTGFNYFEAVQCNVMAVVSFFFHVIVFVACCSSDKKQGILIF